MIRLGVHPKMGRALFASKNIAKGTIIERSPIIILNDEYVKDTPLSLYVYEWREHCALALGMGSLFNHSNRPNIDYYEDFEHNVLVFEANRNIKIGSQLFINYGYDPVTAEKLFYESSK